MPKKSTWTGERLETGIFSETTIEHLHRYAIASELVENKSVLDIACGEGYGSALLAQKATHVTAVDINKEVIERAKSTYKSGNSAFLEGDIENIPAENAQFDVVICFETIEHAVDHEKIMNEIKRVMKPGGMLVISTPDKENYSERSGNTNPFHLKELYRREFEDLLKKHFFNVQLAGQQMVNASLITSGKGAELKTFSGNFNGIRPWEMKPVYTVALASDNTLPSLPDSAFIGQSVFYAALEAQEKNIRNSMSYRLGNAILYPVKILRKLFNT